MDGFPQRICLQCRSCRRYWFNPWVRKIPRGRKWQPIPIFLPGKSHGQRSLDEGVEVVEKGSDTT